MATEKMSKTDEKMRIYVIFSSSGLQDECRIYPIYHPEQEIVKNEKVLDELKNRCKDVEFVGKTVSIRGEKAEYTIAKIRSQRESLDGVVFFGLPWDELLSIDLPVVAVYPLWGQWMALSAYIGKKIVLTLFNAYIGKKVLTSCLPMLYDKDRAIFSSRLNDIAKKIKVIRAISKMKKLKVLVVTDLPVLGYFEPGSHQAVPTREKYEKVYLDNLKEAFGTEFVPIPQEELFEKMNEMKEEEAKEVARKWIDEAKSLKGMNEAGTIKSAKLYLAMKNLMEKYDCGAITTEGYGWPGWDYKRGELPSQGLPSSQLCTEGVVATSETLTDSLLTQQLGLYLWNSTGFDGDYVVDFFNNITVIGHCECPFNPYGDERKVPYVIRNLPYQEENVGGACVQVNLPADETVTVAKIGTHDKKISVFTGKSVCGESLFTYWYDILCRTKLAIRADGKALLKNLDWKAFGFHRVVFYGDHRQEIKDLATLIGFEVVEVDK